MDSFVDARTLILCQEERLDCAYLTNVVGEGKWAHACSGGKQRIIMPRAMAFH